MKKPTFILAAIASCLPGVAGAAPLDALLSARHSTTAWRGNIEAGYDLSDDTVDIFSLRKDSAPPGSRLGDYHGRHLSGGIAPTPRLWLDGALWRRRIDARGLAARIDTWQAAAQYTLLDAAGGRPAVALRLGAWGNRADALSREKNVRFGSLPLKSVHLGAPKDTQYQIDAIASWPLTPRAELSAFIGAGVSKVDFGTASATMALNGCLYSLSFGATAVAGNCAAPGLGPSFSSPNSLYGIDLGREARYRARFYQAGLSARWRSENWQWRAGYHYQQSEREHVDAIIVARGGASYRHNHVAVADLSYRVFGQTRLFLRGQYMARQFNGELPMTYNSLTAAGFDQRYGFLSAGLSAAF